MASYERLDIEEQPKSVRIKRCTVGRSFRVVMTIALIIAFIIVYNIPWMKKHSTADCEVLSCDHHSLKYSFNNSIVKTVSTSYCPPKMMKDNVVYWETMKCYYSTSSPESTLTLSESDFFDYTIMVRGLILFILNVVNMYVNIIIEMK